MSAQIASALAAAHASGITGTRTAAEPASRTTIGEKGPTSGIKPRQAIVTIAVAALLIVAIAEAYIHLGRARGAAIDSIAVLPFVNASGDPNMEYLSDGLAESLMNSLSQLPNLKVMSRNTTFRYKGKQQDAETVGKELNVRAVLTGSLKQIGDEIVIGLFFPMPHRRSLFRRPKRLPGMPWSLTRLSPKRIPHWPLSSFTMSATSRRLNGNFSEPLN